MGTFDENQYEENELPLAYLITFRTFGTWFHGDERTSVARDGRNLYGKPRIPPNPSLEKHLMEQATQPPLLLTHEMRRVVEMAIQEHCLIRGYLSRAINARSNHVHSVISAPVKPERLSDALKAHATKRLREAELVAADRKIWSRGRSRRYLWKPRHVSLAIHYVLYCQDDRPFEMPETKES